MGAVGPLRIQQGEGASDEEEGGAAVEADEPLELRLSFARQLCLQVLLSTRML